MTSTPSPQGLEHRRVKGLVRERLFGATPGPVRIGRFVVLERLGMGGMGVVYSAYDDELGRKVAIKLVRQDRAGGKARDRLRREAQSVAKLSHPNVVQVFEVGTHEEQLYVAMEFVEGMTLGKWVAAEPRTWREIRDVFLEAALGLAVAHDSGLVHRDFKPDNVMVSAKPGPGRVKVLDFGLAAAGVTSVAAAGPRLARADAESLTATGDLLGTPGYMAPEQHLGGRVDARSDQYSFCLSLAEAWVGMRPFVSPDGGVDLDAMREERVGTAPKIGNLPTAMQRLLRRGLAFDPDRRFTDMHALRVALRRDPRVLSRRVAGASVALALVGGATAYGLTVEPATGCAPAEERLTEVWNDSQKGVVRQAVLAAAPAMSLDTWNESVARIDHHLQQWASMHTETCRRETQGEGREEALRTRLCLESNFRTLHGLLQRLERGDPATVAFLPGNIETMPSAEICVDPKRAQEQARRDEMLKTPLPSAAQGQIVSTFEAGLRARFGAGWRWFSDLSGAVDDAPTLSLASPGAQGSASALRITGTLVAPSGEPHWSGAIYYPGPLPGAAVNFTAIHGVRFWARGGPGTFAFAVFTQHGGQLPAYTTFEVSPAWHEYRLHLEGIEPQRYDVTGLFFGAYQPGEYTLEIDDLRIEPQP